jgi:hypothetical protein
MLHEFLQYRLAKEAEGACVMHVPANVPSVFIGESIHVLLS